MNELFKIAQRNYERSKYEDDLMLFADIANRQWSIEQEKEREKRQQELNERIRKQDQQDFWAMTIAAGIWAFAVGICLILFSL